MNLKKGQIGHWIVWIFSVLYSLYRFKKASEKYFFELNNSDFKDGWLCINRPKDQSDFEWIVLKYAFKKYWPVLCLQLILSEVLSRTFKNVLTFFYPLFAIISLTTILGEKATLVCIIFIAAAFFVHRSGRKSYCYALCFCTLMFKIYSHILGIQGLIVAEEKESFLFDVAFTWIIAKCLSFMIDRIDFCAHRTISVNDFSLVVGYCLYLPAVFTGPLFSFNCFLEQIKRRNLPCRNFIKKSFHLIYILFWYLIFEAMLHFIYSSSVQYYPDVVTKYDSWSLCGLAYALPVMFYLKYFIIYSMAKSIASFENVELPPPPKCVSCIHLSTHLWRYIYHPLTQGRKNIFRKMCALAISFFFVCLWHNMDKAVCAWTFLNFILVASETPAKMLFSSEERQSMLKNQRWIYALSGTPHFIVMCISSTFFLANWDMGVILFNRIAFSGVLPLLPLCLIMYCGCQVSLDVSQQEKARQSDNKINSQKYC